MIATINIAKGLKYNLEEVMKVVIEKGIDTLVITESDCTSADAIYLKKQIEAKGYQVLSSDSNKKDNEAANVVVKSREKKDAEASGGSSDPNGSSGGSEKPSESIVQPSGAVVQSSKSLKTSREKEKPVGNAAKHADGDDAGFPKSVGKTINREIETRRRETVTDDSEGHKSEFSLGSEYSRGTLDRSQREKDAADPETAIEFKSRSGGAVVPDQEKKTGEDSDFKRVTRSQTRGRRQ